MSTFYEKRDKWIIRVIYILFTPGMLISDIYRDRSNDILLIPAMAEYIFFLISTVVFITCRALFFKLKHAKKRTALLAIFYEASFNLFFTIFVLWIGYELVAFESSRYAFSVGNTLQIIFAIFGSWFVFTHCRHAWNNGLFNPSCKRWDFDKMKYSVKESRLYDDKWPRDPNKKPWQPGTFVSLVIFFIICVFFALMLHKKDGHSGSIILDLLFRNNPELRSLSNGILVFVIAQIGLWFMLVPSFVLKLLEIKKIRQIEKDKGVRMLVKEQKIFKNL